MEIVNAALIVNMADPAASTTGSLTIQSTGELAFTNVQVLSNALSVGSQFSIFTGKVRSPESPVPALKPPPNKSAAVYFRSTTPILLESRIF